MARKFLLIFALFFFNITQSKAYENPISKLSLDSGYLQDSPRAFWNFGQEMDGVVSTGFDFLNSKFLGESFISRVLLGGVFYWQWKRLEYGFFVANHELGHGFHFYSVGGDPKYQWTDGTSPWQGNIFSFWSKGFTRYGEGAHATSATSFTDQYIPDDYFILLDAGGMNNSTQYAEFIENQITYGGGGHIIQYMGYVRAKEDAATYVKNTNGGESGDVASVLNNYSLKGYDISANDIKTGSLVSRWASSTHWIFISSALEYLQSANPIVKGYFIKGFRAPDISHYLTSRGLSYKIRSGVILGNAYYPIGVEYVYKGEKTIEASLGYRMKAPSADYGVELSANSKSGFGASMDTSYNLSSNLVLALGASYYSGKSLLGERHIVKYLEGGTGGYEAWGRITLDY